MLIPLAQVQGLIGERSELREHAVWTIAQGWGGKQQFGGPVLAIPKRARSTTTNGWVDSTELLLPDQLDIAGTLAPELRHYGIYSTPVYTGQFKLSGQFLARDIAALGNPEATYFWDRAELRVPISDEHGIRRAGTLHFAGADYEFGPCSGGVGDSNAIAVPVDASKLSVSAEKYAFDFELTLAGTQDLSLLPLARRTQVSLSAPWPDPSFRGAFLPAERSVDAQGFQAKWQVLDLNRSFGQHWLQDDFHAKPAFSAAAFGVGLYQPVSIYQQNERAGKYGVLFIALTFVAFFLFEVLKKLRVHPVQYLLIGLALTTFYVVLLALSEQIGFAWSYLVAATLVVLLVGGYAAAVLRTRRSGVLLGATMALVYGLLYGLVVSEQYSLLMGSVALLAIVALLMYLTRRVDWYAATAAKPA